MGEKPKKVPKVLPWVPGLNEIRWKPNDSSLPMEKSESDFIDTITVLILSIFLIFYVIIEYGEEVFQEGNPELFSLEIIILLGGAGMVILFIYVIIDSVIHLSFDKSKVVISSDFVESTKEGLRKYKYWKEPLSNYKGVKMKEIEKSGVKSYSLILNHPEDEKKDIELYKSEDRIDCEESWEHFSKLLKLPTLEQTEEENV